MKLFIDIGNTRLKWRMADGKRIAVEGDAALDDLGRWSLSDLPAPHVIIGCCVANELVRSAVESVCASRWGLRPLWLEVKPEEAGVRNGYDTLVLGPDRWASVIAAYHRASGAAVAVNVGTALTIDAVDAAGFYLGGTIAPGLFLSRQALAQHTARLPLADGRFADFPATTVDAIQTGVIDAACGAIERLYRRLPHAPMLYISGGDAEFLLPHLNLPSTRVDNLVLDGLQVLYP